MKLLKVMWKCWLAELVAQTFTILSGIGIGVSFFFGVEQMNVWYIILGFVCFFLVGIGLVVGDMLDIWEKDLRKEYEKTY